MESLDLSLVIPLFNEEESLPELHAWIHRVMQKTHLRYEVLFIDDGSSDDSWKHVCKLSDHCSHTKGIRLVRNYGKSIALLTGFQHAKGRVMLTMDADLQDSPDEIPALCTMLLEGGYDIVSGWKHKRRDPWSKVLPSKLFNWITSLLSGIPIHDFNCGMKAYRREVAQRLHLYGDMHRYIPLIAKWEGFVKIAEKKVTHYPRKYGRSKYGVERLLSGFLDLLSVSFVTRFKRRPMHFFGKLGLLSFLGGVLMSGYLIAEKLYNEAHLLPVREVTSQPLFYLALVGIVVGTQLFLSGFLAEMFLLDDFSAARRGGGREKKLLMSSYSVIVPVYNRPQGLFQLLHSISQQRSLPLEVIIVEDGSILRAEQIVASFRDQFSLRYMEISHQGPAAARNAGARQAKGTYLVFVDSDVQLPPDYFEVLGSLPSSFVFGGGRDDTLPEADTWQHAIDCTMTAFFTTGGIRTRQGPFERFKPRSHNMIIARSAFFAVEGFHPIRYGEDIDLSIRMEKAGYTGVFIPELSVYHRRKPHIHTFFKQVYHSGFARMRITFKHIHSFRLVHTFPFLFTGMSAFLILLACFSNALATFPLWVYAALVFSEAWVHKKRVWVAFLAMLMAFVQLYGYGLGWLSAGLSYPFLFFLRKKGFFS